MRLIDSHCHLNYEGLVERQDEVLENARNRGVQGFLNISTRQREWNDIIAVAEREPDVWASVGVHPHEADAHPDLGAAALAEAASHSRVIAIGECGLDYYYDKSDRAAQRERFEAHIDAAAQTGLPLVVHTREAEADTAEILERAVKEKGVRGVLHCFTGSAELARKGLDLGFYVSLSGIVTFKNAADLQDTATGSRRTRCWWRRICLPRRRSRTAGRSANRRSWRTRPPSSRTCGERTPSSWVTSPPPTSSNCSIKPRDKA